MAAEPSPSGGNATYQTAGLMVAMVVPEAWSMSTPILVCSISSLFWVHPLLREEAVPVDLATGNMGKMVVTDTWQFRLTRQLLI